MERITRPVVTALLAVTVAIVVRVGAALLDVPVLVPDRSGGARPLEFQPIVIVAAGVALGASLVAELLDRIVPGRWPGTLRLLGLLVLALSFVPVLLSDQLTRANVVTLALLHVLVATVVLRRTSRA